MNNVPNFKYEDGKTEYRRRIVEELTMAVYGKRTKCVVDGDVINIVSSNRGKDSWDVVISGESIKKDFK